jgi:hypothetical protein
VNKKDGIALFVKYGDDAAEAIIKHREICVPLINASGKPAALALKAISKQNGRRMAIMAEDATTVKLTRNNELLGVISKYGDNAMEFIWKNKGALTVASTLSAFLANPQSFIDGAVSLTETGVESVATQIATGISTNLNFNIFLRLIVVAVSGVCALKLWFKYWK